MKARGVRSSWAASPVNRRWRSNASWIRLSIRVERARESPKLVVRQIEIEPATKILRTNVAGQIGDRRDRRQGPSGQQVSTAGRQQKNDRHGDAQADHQDAEHILDITPGCADLQHTDDRRPGPNGRRFDQDGAFRRFSRRDARPAIERIAGEVSGRS